jgi:hypothetical protein
MHNRAALMDRSGVMNRYGGTMVKYVGYVVLSVVLLLPAVYAGE